MTDQKKNLKKTRSEHWFAPDSMRAFAHRQRLAQIGHHRTNYQGKPVIGIISTWSEISTCHSHFPASVKFIREGILRAGGFPLELSALSLSEVMVKPTTMLYRNLLALEVEELIRSHPFDGVVLLGGCDKTIPGLLMGAFTTDIPMILVPAGATLSGNFKGIPIGTGTHTRKYWDERTSGTVSEDDWLQLETVMTRSAGTCNTMGTASTMACIAETLGTTLPNAATTPAVDSAHARLCAQSGERIVALTQEGITPSTFITNQSLENAIAVYGALGGSTNAVVHLIAIAQRLGLPLSLDTIANICATTPVLINLMPAGKYLMEDFHYAGGLSALLATMQHTLHLNCTNINNQTLATRLTDAPCHNRDVILPFDQPLDPRPTMAILYGNICPNGAVIKPVAATPELMEHTGKAVVFESMEQLTNTINNDDLPIDKHSVMVLKNAGPIGGPGMPEWGGLPLPKKLLKQGVRDMVRISDARMSGTHFGTCVLHISPESAIGGPLAAIQNGDEITLSVATNTLTLNITDQELATRQKQFTPPPLAPRGYLRLYQQSVTQAHQGCDFTFLDGHQPLTPPTIY